MLNQKLIIFCSLRLTATLTILLTMKGATCTAFLGITTYTFNCFVAVKI